jgi:hypothetical protein
MGSVLDFSLFLYNIVHKGTRFIPRCQLDDTEAGILKKFSLVGLAKLSRLRYSRLRFGLASAGYRGLGVHDRPVYTAR